MELENDGGVMTLFGNADAPFAPTTMSSNSTETPAPAPAGSTTTATLSTSSTIKKAGGARLPSLNQLAARLSSNAAAANGGAPPALQPSTTSAPRPRLAAFALRTGPGSTTSVSTANTTADSVAVNPPSTRSVSPAASNASIQSNATASVIGIEGGEPLTIEKLEKLNQETGSDSVLKPIVSGQQKKVYKNIIPTLDVIAGRLAKVKASQLSVDGSAMPPEPEMIEDPKTPGVPMKAPEHPLQFPWCGSSTCFVTFVPYYLNFTRTIYHDSKAKFPYTPASAVPGQSSSQPAPGSGGQVGEPPYSAGHPPESTEYEAGLTVIGEFDTVEEFCRYFNWLKPPSKLEKNSNYHIFKSGIKPMWEDPANANGGKWVLTMKNNPALLDRCWNWLAMALVGEELEEGDEICGAVVSLRTKVDRIQVWTRSKDDVEKLNGIGKRLVKLLDVSEADNIGLEFQVCFLP